MTSPPSSSETVEELGTRDDAFYHFFENAGVPPENVVLEITERSAIGNLAVFEATLRHFREHGSGVAVDDAGAGYASLNTIARLKPDFLKFDMALVRDIDQDRIKQELLVTVQDLARRVNARVIAEGIETPGEFATLARMGVELGQGYFFARPKPPGEIEPHFPHEPAKIAYFPTAATPPAGDPRGGPGDG